MKVIGGSVAAALLAAVSVMVAVPAQAQDVSLASVASEEKLARDVYLTLGDMYSALVFVRIASAEQQHLDAVRSLMEAKGVFDPTAGLGVGEFSDPAVQSLFDKLVGQAGKSFASAAQVGVKIEKTDIVDLDAVLASGPAADVVQVLESLRAGSYRHLAAFSRFV